MHDSKAARAECHRLATVDVHRAVAAETGFLIGGCKIIHFATAGQEAWGADLKGEHGTAMPEAYTEQLQIHHPPTHL